MSEIIKNTLFTINIGQLEKELNYISVLYINHSPLGG